MPYMYTSVGVPNSEIPEMKLNQIYASVGGGLEEPLERWWVDYRGGKDGTLVFLLKFVQIFLRTDFL